MTTLSGSTFTLKGSEREKKGAEKLFEEVMAENFSNLLKKTDTQIQEAERLPDKMNSRRLTPRHIIINMSKAKEREIILQAAREKYMYKGTPVDYPPVF